MGLQTTREIVVQVKTDRYLSVQHPWDMRWICNMIAKEPWFRIYQAWKLYTLPTLLNADTIDLQICLTECIDRSSSGKRNMSRQACGLVIFTNGGKNQDPLIE